MCDDATPCDTCTILPDLQLCVGQAGARLDRLVLMLVEECQERRDVLGMPLIDLRKVSGERSSVAIRGYQWQINRHLKGNRRQSKAIKTIAHLLVRRQVDRWQLQRLAHVRENLRVNPREGGHERLAPEEHPGDPPLVEL